MAGAHPGALPPADHTLVSTSTPHPEAQLATDGTRLPLWATGQGLHQISTPAGGERPWAAGTLGGKVCAVPHGSGRKRMVARWQKATAAVKAGTHEQRFLHLHASARFQREARFTNSPTEAVEQPGPETKATAVTAGS